MAPEQASPRWGAVGPATDVYGVGAILYETLTGRPPFRGDSAAETERQLLTDEPVAPTRLNPRVPRDLETICLKCLVKEQARRYPSASAVADELRRFREGLPIRARRSSLPERLVKWVRRRPTAAIAACLALFIAGAAVAGAVWAASTGAAIARAAVEDLDDVLAHQQQSQWDAADAAIQRASVRLAHVLAPTALRMQLHRARQDQALVRRLDAIHVRGTVPEGMPVTGDLVAEDYALAFRESGIGDAAEPAALAADRIRHSPVCAALVSALDYWATVEKEPTRAWVLRVARLADPDPTGWRDRARDLSASLSPAEATAMLNDPAVDRQPVSAMLLLAGRLNNEGGEARDLVIPLLRKAQQAHPADFWTNIYLGMAHTERGHRAKSHADMDDAARFFQAAVAARPGSDVAYHDLGIVLLNRGTVHSAEAAAAFRESLRLNPKAFVSRAMLGRIASSAGRHAEALAEFDEGLSVEPEDAGLHAARGKSLEALLRDAEAAHAFARALTIDVKSTEAVAGLLRLGRLDAYCDVWRDRLVSAPPSDQFYWDGYPELCLYLERHDDYASVRRQLLERFGASSDVRVLERVGRACLLAPVTGQDLHRATAAIDAALASVPREKAWLKPYFEFGRALADYRAGNFAAAAEVGDRLPSSVLGPCPKMLAAMAYARLGQIATARRALAEGVRQFDWSTTVPEVRDRWMYDVLRREADALVLPDLPAFLAGRYFPASNDERVAMTGACQAAARSVAGASLWAAAFASDPALEPRHRGLAIRAAALAGTGRGTDAASLSPEDQHKWRERARQWLRAELVATTEAPPTTRPSTPPEQRATAARATLAGLLKSPDMAGVRDPSLVVQLPADERPAWTDLWRRITKASADG
jgi:serine/threonine-protein kinase